MMRTRPPAVCWVSVVAAAPAALVPSAAFATEYLTVAQAQRLMFPQATGFVPQPVVLTPAQRQSIQARLGAPLNPALWAVSEARDGERLLGYVVTDGVVGKFELIQYAVALTAQGEIRDVEILSYRESHGGEVRTKGWRDQFVGKTAQAPLSVGNDIANISGATLSCTHLTDGVRRIATYVQLALARP